MLIYLSVPIIRNRDLELASFLAGLIREAGHQLASPWVLGDDSSIDPSEIYRRDVSAVRRSDALIAEVSHPSTGVGMEVMLAILSGKPVLCLYRRGSRVSRMILGAPVRVVEYGSPKELRSAVLSWLEELSRE